MNRRTLAATLLTASAATLGATEYQDAWGPPLGSALPSIAALDQANASRELASLSGERGLLLFAVRSADW